MDVINLVRLVGEDFIEGGSFICFIISQYWRLSEFFENPIDKMDGVQGMNRVIGFVRGKLSRKAFLGVS